MFPWGEGGGGVECGAREWGRYPHLKARKSATLRLSIRALHWTEPSRQWSAGLCPTYDSDRDASFGSLDVFFLEVAALVVAITSSPRCRRVCCSSGGAGRPDLFFRFALRPGLLLFSLAPKAGETRWSERSTKMETEQRPKVRKLLEETAPRRG